jgi:hypothetical protein
MWESVYKVLLPIGFSLLVVGVFLLLPLHPTGYAPKVRPSLGGLLLGGGTAIVLISITQTRTDLYGQMRQIEEKLAKERRYLEKLKEDIKFCAAGTEEYMLKQQLLQAKGLCEWRIYRLEQKLSDLERKLKYKEG